MADYSPLYLPAVAFPLTASATITGGQLVEVTGVNTVGPAGAASVKVVGVAAFDAVSGDRVTLHKDGVQRLVASGAVTAGDPLIAGAAGTVVTSATPPAGQQVGVALTTATSGNLVEVFSVR